MQPGRVQEAGEAGAQETGSWGGVGEAWPAGARPADLRLGSRVGGATGRPAPPRPAHWTAARPQGCSGFRLALQAAVSCHGDVLALHAGQQPRAGAPGCVRARGGRAASHLGLRRAGSQVGTSGPPPRGTTARRKGEAAAGTAVGEVCSHAGREQTQRPPRWAGRTPVSLRSLGQTADTDARAEQPQNGPQPRGHRAAQHFDDPPHGRPASHNPARHLVWPEPRGQVGATGCVRGGKTSNFRRKRPVKSARVRKSRNADGGLGAPMSQVKTRTHVARAQGNPGQGGSARGRLTRVCVWKRNRGRPGTHSPGPPGETSPRRLSAGPRPRSEGPEPQTVRPSKRQGGARPRPRKLRPRTPGGGVSAAGAAAPSLARWLVPRRRPPAKHGPASPGPGKPELPAFWEGDRLGAPRAAGGGGAPTPGAGPGHGPAHLVAAAATTWVLACRTNELPHNPSLWLPSGRKDGQELLVRPAEGGPSGSPPGCGTGLGQPPRGTCHGHPLPAASGALGGAPVRGGPAGRPVSLPRPRQQCAPQRRHQAAGSQSPRGRGHAGPPRRRPGRHPLPSTGADRRLPGHCRPRPARGSGRRSGPAGSPRGHSPSQKPGGRAEVPRGFLGTAGPGKVPQSETGPLPGSLPSSRPASPLTPLTPPGCHDSMFQGTLALGRAGGPVPDYSQPGQPPRAPLSRPPRPRRPSGIAGRCRARLLLLGASQAGPSLRPGSRRVPQ